jgi:hypothetical protein
MSARTTGAAADPEDVEEQLEIAAGRRTPFTMVGDWVALIPGLSPQAKALYWHLAMHVSVTRADDWVWPSQEVLAEWLGFSRVQSLTRYVDELEAVGALESETIRYAGGMRQRKRYTVHGTPPEGFTGLMSLKDYYAKRKAELAARPPKKTRRKKAAGGDGVAVERNTGVAPQRKSDVAPGPQSQDAPGPHSQDSLEAQSRDALDPHTKKEDVVQRDEPNADEPSTGATPDAEAAAAAGAPDSGSGKPARSLTKRQQAAAEKRAARTSEQIALDEQARTLTQAWFDRLKESTGAPAVGSPFPAAMKKIRDTLGAGYTEKEIKHALNACAVYLPQAQQWQRALTEVRTAIRSNRRPPAPGSLAGPARRPQTPMYDDKQWERTTESAPALTEADYDRMFGATG